MSLKPHLVRADTLDLQSQDAPSAKDHTRQPTSPSPYGYGTPGPHHTQALRNAQDDAYQEQHQSPRLGQYGPSGANGQQQHQHHHHTNMYDDIGEEDEDEHLNGQHGLGLQKGDYNEVQGNDSHEEDMDDDMMDKISSSPSIEDGKPTWPPRTVLVGHGASQALFQTPTRGESSLFSHSPFPDPTLPLICRKLPNPHAVSHHRGEYENQERSAYIGPLDFQRMPTLQPTNHRQGQHDMSNTSEDSMSVDEMHEYLLPMDDPLLDNKFDTHDNILCDDGDPDWIDDDECGQYSSSDDDTEDFPFTHDSRFIDSGWGGECLREIEDIDFEFVYALHTFVATVEGQANATKGDTMVLLDDSNSYWWLVRVVKDASIGYLPAEHIETPTERLARLNKHRNIDLSASMLGDNAEKSKNPLKKAMRRRNAKTVSFSAPTYYEPSDREWSDDDDMDMEDGDDSLIDANDAVHDDEEQVQHGEHTEPSITLTTEDDQIEPVTNGIHKDASDEDLTTEEPSSPTKTDVSTLSPVQPNGQDALRKSRQGVVRNTDSFYKDDTAETRKISLTPRLLRGDSELSASGEQETRRRPSLEIFDKPVSEEKLKDSGKKKEKKGMLSGLFKRKDKGGKNSRSDTDDGDRISEETGRGPQHKESAESLNGKIETGPERKPSKLQKLPPTHTPPKTSPIEPRSTFSKDPSSPTSTTSTVSPPPGSAPKPVITSNAEVMQFPQPDHQPTQQPPARFPSLTEKRSMFAPITNVLKSGPSHSHSGESEPTVKPIYSKRAKERFAIDESDSEEDGTPTMDHNLRPARSASPLRSPGTTKNSNSAMSTDMDADQAVENSKRMDEVTSRSHEFEQDESNRSEHTASTSKPSPSFNTHTPSTSRSTPTWSDASLRSYMENDQGIRDLLIIVHDKTNVTPVAADHPIMGNLFTTERTRLSAMQSQLDSMLTSWMSKKATGTVGKL